MTQEYTPVAWQDETTSQQGTLINAERLNQMQTAHHYADGWEEVDAIPTADPGVDYHKVVYCTADSTFYRWDGTAWTADIDDDTKRLLQEEIARATEAEGELAQGLADETTARETADTAMQADISALQSGKLDKQTTGPGNITKVYAVKNSIQKMLTVGYLSDAIAQYNIEQTLFSKMPSFFNPTDETVVNYGWATAQIGAETTARSEADTALGGRIDTEQARAEAAEQANAQAIANTYTKAEIDTALALKADQATTYTKGETDTLLASKADVATTLEGYGITDAYTKTEADTLLGAKANDNAVVKLTGNQTITGVKTLAVAGSDVLFLQAQSSVLDQSTMGAEGRMRFRWSDKNGTGPDNRIVEISTYRRANGNNSLYLTQFNKVNNALTSDGLAITLETDGTAHMEGPSRAYSPGNTRDIVTLGLLDAYTPMVRTSGNQNMSGIKTSTTSRGYSARVGNYGVGFNCVSTLDEYNVEATQEIAYPYLAFDDKNGEQAAILRFTHNNNIKKLQFLIKDKNGNFHATDIATWTDA